MVDDFELMVKVWLQEVDQVSASGIDDRLFDMQDG